MILVDSNILLYAEDASSPHHDAAREWWDAQLSGTSPVCLCWTVLGAFVRIGTNPYQDLLIEGQATGNLVTDAHLATLALQHGCELMSTDADFARFRKYAGRIR